MVKIQTIEQSPWTNIIAHTNWKTLNVDYQVETETLKKTDTLFERLFKRKHTSA